MFRSLLVPLDLTDRSERVLGRTALLPLAGSARITLLHVIPRTLPRRSRQRAERDARAALATYARTLARAVPKGVAVDVQVRTGSAATEIAKVARAVRAELIVVGRGRGRAVRDMFIGSTAERVIRAGKLPVLLVRMPPRAPYRRPALALDLDRTAYDATAGLLRLLPQPRPRVTVLHVYDAPYQTMIYPSLTLDEAEEHRAYYRRKAQRQLEQLLVDAVARAGIAPEQEPSWQTEVRFGSPRIVIRKRVDALGADLLALGTHAYSGAAHAFLGSVAGDLVREVACDALVVPPRGNAAGKR